jgi:hypothetical protein
MFKMLKWGIKTLPEQIKCWPIMELSYHDLEK